VTPVYLSLIHRKIQ